MIRGFITCGVKVEGERTEVPNEFRWRSCHETLMPANYRSDNVVSRVSSMFDYSLCLKSTVFFSFQFYSGQFVRDKQNNNKKISKWETFLHKTIQVVCEITTAGPHRSTIRRSVKHSSIKQIKEMNKESVKYCSGIRRGQGPQLA